MKSDLNKQLSLTLPAFSGQGLGKPCRIGSACGKGGSRKFSNSAHVKEPGARVSSLSTFSLHHTVRSMLTISWNYQLLTSDDNKNLS